MANCQACGTEIIGQDRFCRQCGARVISSVTDWEDTQRFNASAAPSATTYTSPGETTKQFYHPAAYPIASGGIIPEQSVSLLKRLLLNKIAWLAVVVLFFTLVAAGLAHRAFESPHQDQAEEVEIARHQFEVAVQNALGFKHRHVSEAEFPGIKGIFVNSLMSDDSAAALAQIQAGDVLLELNGQAVRNESELEKVLNSLQTGAEAPVKIYRDGEIIDSRIRIADRNFPPLMPKIEPRDQGFLGIKNSSRRCCIPSTKKWGIEVGELHENGPADLFGLKAGDVITEFNGLPTRTTSEFNRHIRAVKPRSKVMLKFLRGNTEQTVEILMGHRWEDPRWR